MTHAQVLHDQSHFPHKPSPYSVRLAQIGELEEVFKLRYDIFYQEMGASDAVTKIAGLDVDDFDEFCDHLVVTYNEKIIGTYRLLPLERLKGTGRIAYSETEFDVSNILSRYQGKVLELGRSCVHPDFRTGTVPRLLWAAIIKYVEEYKLQALIGCVSIHGISDLQALRLRDAIHERHLWHEDFDCLVKPKFFPSSDAIQAYEEHLTTFMVPTDPFKLMPPLMKGYFNLNAKVCGGPAHDKPFHCHDFLMLMDMDLLPERQRKLITRPLDGHAIRTR